MIKSHIGYCFSKTKRLIIIFLTVIIIFLSQSSNAQALNVPVSIQAPLLIKILKFNPKFKEKRIKMLIVYDSNSEIYVKNFISILKDDINITAVKGGELPEHLDGADIVYFMPGMQDYSGVCKDKKILSVSSVEKYVENGDISLAIGIKNNKPKIFINLDSLKTEENTFSADLLRIAKVY